MGVITIKIFKKDVMMKQKIHLSGLYGKYV